MNGKIVVSVAGIALLAGFVLGRISVGELAESSTGQPEQTAQAMREFEILADKFEQLSQRSDEEMSWKQRRFFESVVSEYKEECLFSITPDNKFVCARFQAALQAHNELNRRERIKRLIES